MKYLACLILSWLMQILAWVVTPILPWFKQERPGWSNNGRVRRTGWRLPFWLAWFDTPDNDLLGDSRWAAEHSGGYWSMVGWLYRNSLYGFKWAALAMPVQQEREVVGNHDIGYQGNRFGSLRITQPNGAWQYKIVTPFCGRIFEGNFGWLLDDTSKEKALFMFSPRFKELSP